MTRVTDEREVRLRTGVILTTDRPVMTHDEWFEELLRRFGERPEDWTFVCPNCGDHATPADFANVQSGSAGQECIGRHLKGRGCDWAAYGILGTKGQGRLVELSDGVVEVFDFAEPAAS